MAISKKRKTRKTGAKKRKARVGVAAAPKSRIKISGVNFTRVPASCGTKTDAKKRADSIRAKGTRARVMKSGKSYCVYTGGRSKTLARRRAA